MSGSGIPATGGQALLSAPEATVPPEAPAVPEAPVHVSRYLARPGRRALVIADLDDLRGPVDGTVELPIWLFWQSSNAFDLGDPAMRRWMYQIVLREASRPSDLTAFLNRDVLTELWPDLGLPRGVRRAWEELHPALAVSLEVAGPAKLTAPDAVTVPAEA